MPAFDPCVALKGAESALNDISIGGAVRSVTDQNGETVVYQAANRASLIAYMSQLQAACPTYTSVLLAQMKTRPMRFLFA